MEEIANMHKKMQDDITEQRKELKSLQENISKPIIENMDLKFKEIVSTMKSLRKLFPRARGLRPSTKYNKYPQR
ncbi:unnamed protein product [Parnassius apollo]|uniref:(apollo) hypothetical protein n=1 Tax=Parnassius apollo TaxID=110799 RepID=A0A8S3XG87_PARAO|nr:unnamed protein product [Parnassius apollo]